MKPGEEHHLEVPLNSCLKLIRQSFTIIAKSSMVDVDPEHHGRSYGGVCTIIKHQPAFTARSITTMSDRIVAVGICDTCDKPLQMIINVYMPYFSSLFSSSA